MLLMDGAKYFEYTPKDEDELEQMVIEHAKDIFGENSMYLDKKYKLKSPAGIGSIPDGFAITFGAQNQWHIVEVELSSHDPYSHVTPQLDKFLSGIDSGNTKDKIITSLYSAINSNEHDKIELKKVLGSTEIHEFISQLIKNSSPVITVILEKDSPTVDEAIKKYSPARVVFRTFRRVGAEAVHAHLFEPIGFSSPSLKVIPNSQSTKEKKFSYKNGTLAKPVTFAELVGAGLIHDKDTLFFYNKKPFKEEMVEVIASENRLLYLNDGEKYSKSKLADILLRKHGLKKANDLSGAQGPLHWITKNDEKLIDLEEQIRIKRGDRKQPSLNPL